MNKDTLDKAAAALLKQFEACDANDNDSKAVILHALSTDKRADFANCNRLYRDRNALGNSALAHLARAFFNLDRREIATELATLARSPRSSSDAGQPVVWEGGCKTDLAQRHRRDHGDGPAGAGGNHAHRRRPPPPPPSRLLRAHGCFGFPYPRAHGPAVAALSAWFAQGVQQATDMEIGVVVNGKEIGTVKTVATLGQHLLPVPTDLRQGGQERGRVQDARTRPLHLRRHACSGSRPT